MLALMPDTLCLAEAIPCPKLLLDGSGARPTSWSAALSTMALSTASELSPITPVI